MSTRKVIIAGGSGFLGQLLCRHLLAQGYEPCVLTRAREKLPGQPDAREVPWDGRTLGDWSREFEGALAVINLSGRSVDCRYHAANRKLILDSRVESTRIIGTAIARCDQPPQAWLNASTATLYRHTFGPAWDESGEIEPVGEAKDAFSVEVAKAWEGALDAASVPRTRKIALRTSMVLGLGRNSVYPVLRRLAAFGLAGPMAGGRQFVSWIHGLDYCRAVEWLLSHGDVSGAFNITAPEPLTNMEMMRCFRDLVGRRFGLPASRWMLELGAFFVRTETELILKSRRVIPGRLLQVGFKFEFPNFKGALADLSQTKG